MNDLDRNFMLDLARKALVWAVANGQPPEAGKVSPTLAEEKACFVTLTRDGSLRGCLGQVRPQQPLYQAIINNTQGAALRDPRFPPVQPHEVQHLRIEISILSEPEPVPFASPDDLLGKLRAHEHGVLLEVGPRMATFLPQVWRTIPDRVEFLQHLSQKAGCAPDAWREQGAAVSVYHVDSCEEG
jgi:uncharacterized protein